ncbi:MAG: hypothetical protein KBA51_06010 [Kiritimatiellae bacterium]|nr:hypothetical protein [Kiritimatiellia bacterium]
MNRADIIRGMLIYGAGDGLAAWLGGEFSWSRFAGMAGIGATVYAFEVPAWFRRIDRTAPAGGGAASWRRTGWALLYFNPLWIARHLLFIRVFSGNFDQINMSLLSVGAKSFFFNIPLSVTANWLIQNRLPQSFRFTASALFSAAMAVYYAWSGRWFQ